MASRKLYDDVAPILRDLALAPSDREVVIAALSGVLKRDNPNFDEDVFRAACRPEGAPRAVDSETLTRILIDYQVDSFANEQKPTLQAVVDVARDGAAEVLKASTEIDGL